MCDFSCNCGQVRASYVVNMIQGHHTTKSFTIHTSSSRMVHSSTASLSIPMKGLPTALPICIWKSQVDLMVHVAKRSTSGLNFFFQGDRKKKAFPFVSLFQHCLVISVSQKSPDICPISVARVVVVWFHRSLLDRRSHCK